MRQKFICLSLALMLTACAAQPEKKPDFDQIATEVWKAENALSPRSKPRLPDLSAENLQAQYQQRQQLLQRLQRERKMGLMLISHDLGVVAGIAEEVAIMYAGRVCEKGPVETVFDRPHHPYTFGLLESLPKIDRTEDQLVAIPGSLPTLSMRPSGCRFHPRCNFAQAICAEADPALETVQDPLTPGVVAACHFAETALYTDQGAGS